ncbi:hypothetical protein B0H14DRAFT_2758026 [Mycena olivaceomarginata]|nr:hypothetical protein B0H14DRAFT_2758026 [Mycena olivaceomarginata]
MHALGRRSRSTPPSIHTAKLAFLALQRTTPPLSQDTVTASSLPSPLSLSTSNSHSSTSSAAGEWPQGPSVVSVGTPLPGTRFGWGTLCCSRTKGMARRTTTRTTSCGRRMWGGVWSGRGFLRGILKYPSIYTQSVYLPDAHLQRGELSLLRVCSNSYNTQGQNELRATCAHLEPVPQHQRAASAWEPLLAPRRGETQQCSVAPTAHDKRGARLPALGHTQGLGPTHSPSRG